MIQKFMVLAAVCTMASPTFGQTNQDAEPVLLSNGLSSEIVYDFNGHGRMAMVQMKDVASTDVLREVEGKGQIMEKSSAGYLIKMGKVREYTESGLASWVVWGDNNEVYIKNVVSTYPTGTYVKGEKQGDKVVVTLPQSVLTFEESSLNLAGLKKVMLPEGNKFTYVYDSERTSISYSIGEDGSLTLEDLGEDGMIGYVGSDESWIGYGDHKQTYIPFGEEPISIPDGVETEVYTCREVSFGHTVEVSYDGGYLYIRGLSPHMPSATVRATLDGDKATIAQNEFLGVADDNYFVFTKCVEDDPNVQLRLAPEDAVFELIVDRENKVITCANPDMYLSINAAMNKVYYVSILRNFTLFVQNGYAGVPMTPYDLNFEDLSAWYGFYDFNFLIPNITTEGNLMKAGDIYYRIFVNDEVMEFEADEDGIYTGIPEGETWTEIPFDFTNENEFFTYTAIKRGVGLYAEGIESVGVQSIYRYDDKETYSEIISMDVATGETTVGVKNIETDLQLSTQYFDLNGRRVNSPSGGIFVKKQTMADGTARTSKVILK